MRASSSAERAGAFSASRFWSSWATLLAPMRAEVTTGRPQDPLERHLGEALAARLGDLVQLPGALDLVRGHVLGAQEAVGVEAREPFGMPARYLSESRPWASGEKAMQPMPSFSSTAVRPPSIQRSNIE